MSSIISEYLKRSPLRNPYGSKNDVWKWPYLIYKNRNARGRNKHRSITISAQTNRFKARGLEDMVMMLMYSKNVALEDNIPSWDIDAEDLQTFYDEARFQKFLDWEYEDVIDVDGKRQCKKVSLKLYKCKNS